MSSWKKKGFGGFNTIDAFIAFVLGGIGLLLLPDQEFAKSQVDGWKLALFLFAAMTVVGVISAVKFYSKNDPSKLDPFYSRAFSWGVASLLLVLVMLIFRPLAVIMAVIMLCFNAGAALGFNLYRLIFVSRGGPK